MLGFSQLCADWWVLALDSSFLGDLAVKICQVLSKHDAAFPKYNDEISNFICLALPTGYYFSQVKWWDFQFYMPC